jgi:hypothetical protein
LFVETLVNLLIFFSQSANKFNGIRVPGKVRRDWRHQKEMRKFTWLAMYESTKILDNEYRSLADN